MRAPVLACVVLIAFPFLSANSADSNNRAKPVAQDPPYTPYEQCLNVCSDLWEQGHQACVDAYYDPKQQGVNFVHAQCEEQNDQDFTRCHNTCDATYPPI